MDKTTTKVIPCQWHQPLVGGVCEDRFPPINSEATDVCCMPGGRIEGYRERIWGP